MFKKMIQAGAKAAEIAAPIVGGALGGPAGAKVGQMAAGGIKKIASSPKLGGAGSQGQGTFIPSSASSIGDARAQDKSRMKDQYGIEY
jgi:hypothetical protein